MKDSIPELRRKGASHAVIADILRDINVPVASDTIFRFCHEILNEPMTRRHKRRKGDPTVPKEGAPKNPRKDNKTGTDGKADHLPIRASRCATGPHIADPNTI